MSNRIGCQYTVREIDALLTLDVFPAAWWAFDSRTWQSLVNKGVVTFCPKPTLTPKGKAFVLFTRVPTRLQAIPSELLKPGRRTGATSATPRARASETLGTFGKSKAAEES